MFSRAQLLDRVWGSDLEIELRTVDATIRRLRRALNADGEADLLRTVRAEGYSLDHKFAAMPLGRRARVVSMSRTPADGLSRASGRSSGRLAAVPGTAEPYGPEQRGQAADT